MESTDGTVFENVIDAEPVGQCTVIEGDNAVDDIAGDGCRTKDIRRFVTSAINRPSIGGGHSVVIWIRGAGCAGHWINRRRWVWADADLWCIGHGWSGSSCAGTVLCAS